MTELHPGAIPYNSDPGRPEHGKLPEGWDNFSQSEQASGAPVVIPDTPEDVEASPPPVRNPGDGQSRPSHFTFNERPYPTSGKAPGTNPQPFQYDSTPAMPPHNPDALYGTYGQSQANTFPYQPQQVSEAPGNRSRRNKIIAAAATLSTIAALGVGILISKGSDHTATALDKRPVATAAPGNTHPTPSEKSSTPLDPPQKSSMPLGIDNYPGNEGDLVHIGNQTVKIPLFPEPNYEEGASLVYNGHTYQPQEAGKIFIEFIAAALTLAPTDANDSSPEFQQLMERYNTASLWNNSERFFAEIKKALLESWGIAPDTPVMVVFWGDPQDTPVFKLTDHPLDPELGRHSISLTSGTIYCQAVPLSSSPQWQDSRYFVPKGAIALKDLEVYFNDDPNADNSRFVVPVGPVPFTDIDLGFYDMAGNQVNH